VVAHGIGHYFQYITGCDTKEGYQYGLGEDGEGGHGVALTKSHVTLRGTLDSDGKFLTALTRGGPGVDNNPFSPVITMGVGINWEKSDHFPLAADGVKGSRSVTLTSTPATRIRKLMPTTDTFRI
jgi:hypothetical protein